MAAAHQFLQDMVQDSQLQTTSRIKIDLYGSLALTGKGHGTDRAIIAGLEGFTPDTVDPQLVLSANQRMQQQQRLHLNQQYWIAFNLEDDLQIHQQTFLPLHSNGMRFCAENAQGHIVRKAEFYSIGGGFIATPEALGSDDMSSNTIVKYPFATAADLLQLCQQQQLSIAEIILANEVTWRSEVEITNQLDQLITAMFTCIEHGCHSTEKTLPGGLNVKRRAPDLLKKLQRQTLAVPDDKLNWLNLFALAVNEENAAGGRIVTAPTNGAAGIIPAVLKYYQEFCPQATKQGMHYFLLTAGAIAILYKKGASISAAEVGCQGEIGVAASMAAGALTAALGGTPLQIENAAEIAMEHNLGLTCDPIAGLVQIPCIERNTMGAVQAVNAAYLALMESGEHHVSLDKVIATMLQTGKDMTHHYKETSLGGLAVNVPEC